MRPTHSPLGRPAANAGEVTVIVAATIAVGALGYSRSTFQTVWALPVIAIYPVSLITVQLLDSLLGWQ